jgi:hypothetical protein
VKATQKTHWTILAFFDSSTFFKKDKANSGTDSSSLLLDPSV